MEKSFNKTIKDRTLDNKDMYYTIKEVQKRLVQICNESGLSPIVLELILQNLLSEVRLMIEKQIFEEEKQELLKEEDNESE